MNCTKQVPGARWEHHCWRRRVSSTKSWSSPVTDMWGRVFTNEYVACHKQDVCEKCGTTREGPECSCDPAQADRCTLRLACISRTHQASA
jgi:hypothetical protein